MITIGGKEHATRKPRDLDKQLLDSTGHDAAGMERLLAGVPSPGIMARAVQPFLGKDGPSLTELARSLADDPESVVAVRALYKVDESEAAPLPTPPGGGEE